MKRVEKVCISLRLMPVLQTKKDMDVRLEKIYEEFSDIFASRKGRYVRAARLSAFHSRLGEWSDALDNVLYAEVGMSCEEIIKMLRQGNVSI